MPDPFKQIGAIILGIIGIILLVVIGFGLVIPTINNAFAPKTCPSCDCSSYQINLTTCSGTIDNLTKQLNETPIRYVNVTVDKPIYIDKPVYKDPPLTVFILSVSFIFILYGTIKLFKIKIQLPKWLEKKLKKIEDLIITFKWIYLVVTIISSLIAMAILIKLIIIFFSLF